MAKRESQKSLSRWTKQDWGTKSGKPSVQGPEATGDAYAQGVHRYSRNIRYFNEAMDLAYLNEWEFNWRLVIADGPGHSPADMFNHPQIENALFGHRE